MSEINQGEFKDAIEELVPSYQRAILIEALQAESFDYERLGLILTGEYKVGGQIVQTSLVRKEGGLWEHVIGEIYDYFCTKSAKYKEERAQTGVTIKSMVGIIASSIAATYHLALGVVAGAVTLALMSVLKVSKNAWCSLQHEKRKQAALST